MSVIPQLKIVFFNKTSPDIRRSYLRTNDVGQEATRVRIIVHQ